ncbi:MAG: hypothetical protein WAR79_08965, partial [Melioribacteraceae bacterium]
PKTALRNENNYKVVYKVKDNKAYKVNVETGKDFDQYIEIVNGLENGDEIIDNLNESVKEGIKVKINK